MKASSQLQSLVDQMPDPDDRGLYSQIDKEKVEKAVEQIQAGGLDNLIGLIEMLVPPGEGDDAKAHYALHCLAIRLGKPGNEEHRRQFALALASQIGGDRPKAVQRYLVQQLQVAGDKQVADTLGTLLADEELCEPAAQALAAIGDGAAEQLRQALPRAQGKCRLTVVQNLGVVRDTVSAQELRSALNDSDRETRLAAAWALANIGDAGAVDLLIRTADAEERYEKIKATQACLLLAENLLAVGKKDEARRIYTHLRDTRTDPADRYVHDAAQAALAAAK